MSVAQWLVSSAGSNAVTETSKVRYCFDSDAYARVDLCDVPVQDGDTALLVACAAGQLEVAQWLVSSAGSDVVTDRRHV